MVAVSRDVSPGAGEAPGRPYRRRLFTRFSTTISYGMAAVAIAIGWQWREQIPISAEEGAGYWLGILGASMMAVLLLYPVRKRFALVRFIGSTAAWFRVHMMLGVVGPVLILYHCNFQVASLNGRVALLCTLLVACSGLVGRYIYSKIHIGLYGRKASLQALTDRARLTASEKRYTSTFVPDLIEAMVKFDEMVMTPPATMIGCALLPLRLAVKTRWARFRLNHLVRQRLRKEAREAGGLTSRQKRLQKKLKIATRDCISHHLAAVQQVAELGFYERLFSLWHLLHLPLFYMLVLTAILHVVAVHMY